MATTAERIFTRLAPPARREARTLFLRLVKIGEGNADTSRRVPRTELLGAGAGPAGTGTPVRLREPLAGPVQHMGSRQYPR